MDAFKKYPDNSILCTHYSEHRSETLDDSHIIEGEVNVNKLSWLKASCVKYFIFRESRHLSVKHIVHCACLIFLGQWFGRTVNVLFTTQYFHKNVTGMN